MLKNYSIRFALVFASCLGAAAVAAEIFRDQQSDPRKIGKASTPGRRQGRYGKNRRPRRFGRRRKP